MKNQLITAGSSVQRHCQQCMGWSQQLGAQILGWFVQTKNGDCLLLLALNLISAAAIVIGYEMLWCL